MSWKRIRWPAPGISPTTSWQALPHCNYNFEYLFITTMETKSATLGWGENAGKWRNQHYLSNTPTHQTEANNASVYMTCFLFFSSIFHPTKQQKITNERVTKPNPSASAADGTPSSPPLLPRRLNISFKPPNLKYLQEKSIGLGSGRISGSGERCLWKASVRILHIPLRYKCREADEGIKAITNGTQ